MLRRMLDDFGHRPERARPCVGAALQVRDDVVDRPVAKTFAGRAPQAGGEPPFAHAAFEARIALDAAQHVLGRMAGAAVTEAFDEILPAIPLGGTKRVGRELAFMEEQKVPACDGSPHAHRPRQIGRAHALAHRRQRIQECLDGEHVVVRQMGEPGIGKRGIQMVAVRPPAFVHRPPEVVVRPPADARFPIRREVRRVDRAEGRWHRSIAGIGPSTLRGVACRAVARLCEIAAARDARMLRIMRDRARCTDRAKRRERGGQSDDGDAAHG